LPNGAPNTRAGTKPVADALFQRNLVVILALLITIAMGQLMLVSSKSTPLTGLNVMEEKPPVILSLALSVLLKSGNGAEEALSFGPLLKAVDVGKRLIRINIIYKL